MYQPNHVMCISGDYDIKVTCVHCGYTANIPTYSSKVIY